MNQAEDLDKTITAQIDQDQQELKLIQSLVEQKQALTDQASAKMGLALGSLEATAALSFALKNNDKKNRL